MSSKKGLLKTCDRCGATIFLKTIGDGETDGGYTRWNKFEEPPKGWCMRLMYDFCPECLKQFEETIDDFMKKGK